MTSDPVVTRVAVDLLGGDRVSGEDRISGADSALGDDSAPGDRSATGADGRPGDLVPGAVLDGLLETLDAAPGLNLTLVGPAAALADALADRGIRPGGRVDLADGPEYIGAADDPGRAVRARRRASVRIAARLVRDGQADAVVSRGPVAAVAGAAGFVLGRVPGATRAPLARVLTSPGGAVVLLDAGASQEATPDLLGQFALLGAAYAAARFHLAKPRVGLLSAHPELAASDAPRRAAVGLLAELITAFVGPVTADAIASGGVADVIVTDGFTGSVVLAALDGAARTRVPTQAAQDQVSGAEALDDLGGGVAVLGIDGVVVRAGAGPRAVADAVLVAARLHAAGLPAATRSAMADLVTYRRGRAGLPT